MIVAAIGATIASASAPSTPPPPSRSSRLPPNIAPHWIAVATNDTTLASIAAIEAIKMSRLWMWASSWAMTPRSSRSVSSRRMPVVTATTPCAGLRPVANALGAGSSMTYRRGVGISARAASSATIRSSAGSVPGATGRARFIASTMRSEKK